MAGFIEHIEHHLGPILHGWSEALDGTPMPFQIIECQHGNLSGASAFMTLGLSNVILRLGRPDGAVRQELLMLAPSRLGEGGVPDILRQVACGALDGGSAYLRGELIGPRGALFEGSSLEALYVTVPTYYPPAFAEYDDGNDTPIVIAWLLPVTAAEARYVRANGWSKFEDLLEKADPDLLDITRSSLV